MLGLSLLKARLVELEHQELLDARSQRERERERERERRERERERIMHVSYMVVQVRSSNLRVVRRFLKGSLLAR